MFGLLVEVLVCPSTSWVPIKQQVSISLCMNSQVTSQLINLGSSEKIRSRGISTIKIFTIIIASQCTSLGMPKQGRLLSKKKIKYL